MGNVKKSVVPYVKKQERIESSNRRKELIPHARRLEPECWGDTSESDSSKIVYVTNYHDSITIDCLRGFFGRDKLRGIFKRGRFAYVYFNRPLDYSNALSLHKANFRGKSIHIEPFKDRSVRHQKPPKEPLKRSDSQERWVANIDTRPDRSRSKSSHRSRSPNRDRSHSRSRSSSESDRDNRLEPVIQDPVAAPTDSGNFNFFQNFNSGPVPTLPPYRPLSIPQSSFNSFNQPVFAQASSMLPGNHPNSQRMALWNLNMPSDIRLTLQLVLEQGSARDLSYIQIQKIITYFESEKEHVQNNMRCNDPGAQPSGSTMQQGVIPAFQQNAQSGPSDNSNNPRHQQSQNLNSGNHNETDDDNLDSLSQDGSSASEINQEETLASITKALFPQD